MTREFSHKTGAALIAVTAMIVVGSLVVAGVYYFLQKGARVSGLEKRYQTAREASLGGIDVFTKEVLAGALQGTALNTIVGNFASLTNARVVQGASTTCFRTKVLNSNGAWDASCGIANPDPKTNPDITFQLSAVAPAQYFNVYAKIIDTTVGNSDRSGFSLEGQGVSENVPGIAVEHFPYTYRIEVQGERQAAPEEKVKFSILYAY